MKHIKLELLSDGTFGRGDGVPGLVDDEIDHDPSTGLPYVKGRTIKGLLVEECANILHSIAKWTDSRRFVALKQSAQRLFGSPGSVQANEGNVHFGEGHLHDEIVNTVMIALQSTGSVLTAFEVLGALTGIRRRSAMDEATEAPKDETLRAARVLMRQTEFFVPLVELGSLIDQDWQLLSACVSGLQRGGKNRNRGAGRLHGSLLDDRGVDQTSDWTRMFLDSIPEGAAQ